MFHIARNTQIYWMSLANVRYTLALKSDDTLIMELFSILDSLLAVHAGI